jgi:uncharacterized protein
MRLLYLHGFRSSPQSSKAKLMASRVRAANLGGEIDWYCPQLPPSPAQAFEGGFYAAALSERLTRVGQMARCVLLNPAVNPARDLAAKIGPQTNWHDEQTGFEFTREHVAQLGQISDNAFSKPERYMTIIAKGDEVLDWREMTARYPAQKALLLEGGDHAISDFEMYVDEVLAFCRAA